MQTDELKYLIEKFFNGETSVDEERQLKAYFSGGNIPGKFQEVKDYFAALQQEKEPELGEDFDKNFFEKLEENSPKIKAGKRWLYSVVSAAAIILLLIWFGTKIFGTKEEYGTIDDPVLAFNETRKALDMASVEMSKGLTPTEQTVKTVDENLQKVYQLGKWHAVIEKTGKLLQTTNSIISKDNL